MLFTRGKDGFARPQSRTRAPGGAHQRVARCPDQRAKRRTHQWTTGGPHQRTPRRTHQRPLDRTTARACKSTRRTPPRPFAGAITHAPRQDDVSAPKNRPRGLGRSSPLTRGRLPQVREPQRIGLGGTGQQSPVSATWRLRSLRQAPSQFAKGVIRLAPVASGATSHAVLPGVRTAPAPGNDVVDGFRANAAVRATVIVPHHQRRAGQRNPPAVRNMNELAEPDDRGDLHAVCRGVPGRTGRIAVYDLGLAADDKHDRSAQWQRGQRLERRVEQQHPPLRPGPHAFGTFGRRLPVATLAARGARSSTTRRRRRRSAARDRFSVGHSTTSTVCREQSNTEPGRNARVIRTAPPSRRAKSWRIREQQRVNARPVGTCGHREKHFRSPFGGDRSHPRARLIRGRNDRETGRRPPTARRYEAAPRHEPL